MMPREFFIVAHARSGSNQLVRYINQLPNVRCHGEIFKPRFTEDSGWKQIANMFKSEIDARSLLTTNLSDYWRTIVNATDSSKQFVGAKIFYNHRQNDSIWHYIFSGEPRLIHLWRDDIFATFVSLLIAEKTGSWLQLRGAQQSEKPKVEFDEERYKSFRTALCSNFANVRNKIESRGLDALEIEYASIPNLREMSTFLSEFFDTEACVKQTLEKQNVLDHLEYCVNRDIAREYVSDRVSTLARR